MAITKTCIYRNPPDLATTTATFENLYNFLNENAVPDYFDSVEVNKEGNSIICKIDEREFLWFPSSESSGILIALANGMRLDIGNTVLNYGYAYKMKHGIFIGTCDTGRYFTPLFSICKDDKDNTTIIFADKNFTSSTRDTDLRIKAVNPNTTVAGYPYLYINRPENASNITGKTVLAPIVVGDTESYTPNVFFMPYAQNRSEGILDIDGVKYYSNGIWCIKDE